MLTIACVPLIGVILRRACVHVVRTLTSTPTGGTKGHIEFSSESRVCACASRHIHVAPKKQRAQSVSKRRRTCIGAERRIADNHLTSEVVVHTRVQDVEVSHESRRRVNRDATGQSVEVTRGRKTAHGTSSITSAARVAESTQELVQLGSKGLLESDLTCCNV